MILESFGCVLTLMLRGGSPKPFGSSTNKIKSVSPSSNC